jgi:hypothetical protein
MEVVLETLILSKMWLLAKILPGWLRCKKGWEALKSP